MKTVALFLSMCGLLSACAIGQDVYDQQQIEECRDLPTPNERLDCERAVRDEAAGFPND